jgi:plastocyanin
MHGIYFSSFALCVALAGCSSSDTTPVTTDTGTPADTGTVVDTGSGTDTGTAMDTGTATDTGSATETGPTKHTVTVDNFAFAPKDLTIKVGDTVEWTWVAGSHSVTSGTSCTSDGKFDSTLVPPPKTFTHTFDTAGSFPYFCIAHCASSGMVGSVTVTP